MCMKVSTRHILKMIAKHPVKCSHTDQLFAHEQRRINTLLCMRISHIDDEFDIRLKKKMKKY